VGVVERERERREREHEREREKASKREREIMERGRECARMYHRVAFRRLFESCSVLQCVAVCSFRKQEVVIERGRQCEREREGEGER